MGGVSGAVSSPPVQGAACFRMGRRPISSGSSRFGSRKKTLTRRSAVSMRSMAAQALRVTGMALAAEHLERPGDVGGRHGRAVGEAGAGIEGEMHGAAVGRDLDAFGQRRVEREGLTVTAGHKCLVDMGAHGPGGIATQHEGVEAVEAADLAHPQRPPAGRVRVHVGKGLEPRRQRRFAVHRDRMRHAIGRRRRNAKKR